MKPQGAEAPQGTMGSGYTQWQAPFSVSLPLPTAERFEELVLSTHATLGDQQDRSSQNHCETVGIIQRTVPECLKRNIQYVI